MTAPLNIALMSLSRRAEANDPETLTETFVNVGPLLTLLQSRDDQVLFGRRGTGKTHALTYLAQSVRANGGEAIFIDLRNVGSSGGLYADGSLSIQERGTRLLTDVMEAIHGRLVDLGLEGAYNSATAGDALPLLDILADAISQVRVLGPVEHERTLVEAQSQQLGAKIGLSRSAPSVEGSYSDITKESATVRVKESGQTRPTIRFRAITTLMPPILAALGIKRLWLLLDEWSSLPADLQPLLADLLRRSIMPLQQVVLKIAAIEDRSSFFVPGTGGRGGLGLELGADAAADLNLDDFMVFEQDEAKAQAFFGELLFKHVTAVLRDRARDAAFIGFNPPGQASEFMNQAFTQVNAFTELVRSAEGVPRDAINVAVLAAQRADANTISVPDVRQAAQTWYTRDKQKAVLEHEQAQELLYWIVDDVIKQKRAKAFLLEQGEAIRHPLIRLLYDARVIHTIRKGIAHKDTPGRYNAYALDYGCYVDLMTTQRAPLGVLPIEVLGTDSFVSRVSDLDVPSEDFRSIRRGILKLTDFEQHWTATQSAQR